MGTGMRMRRQDMIELYQLLWLYSRTYHPETTETERLIEALETRYKEAYGQELRQARNPRDAGRKKVYTEETEQRIIELHKKNYSLRRIAREEGCSLGKVQDVLKNKVYGN